MTEQNNWAESARIWTMIVPPLSPQPEDGELMMALGAPHLPADRIGQVLVLGVTPPIVGLNWPGRCEITAVDASVEMIQGVWQPSLRHASRAIQADWRAMPLADASIDLVVGDCSFNALISPELYAPVAREVARVMRPGAALVVRSFMPPEGFMTVAAVVQRAMQGGFVSAPEFRLHLIQACARRDGCVVLTDVLETFNRLIPDRQALIDATGWTREAVDRADFALGRPLQLTYPTEREFMAWTEGVFALDSVRCGTYPCAAICPTRKLRPTAV